MPYPEGQGRWKQRPSVFLQAGRVAEFHGRLKQAPGPTKLMLVDGSDKSARNFHLLNGSDGEGLSDPADGERRPR